MNDSDTLAKVVEIVKIWKGDHNVKHMHRIADVVKDYIDKVEEE